MTKKLLTLAWRTVADADRNSSHGYCWPRSGQWAESSGPWTLGAECPTQPGDGLCLAKTFSGASSGGYSIKHAILCAYDPDDILGEDDNKIRVKRAKVIRRLDIPRMIRDGLFSGANLRGANIEGADLQWANLSGANLGMADLREANLQRANLRGANLRRANLRRANLYGANLQGADLAGADLSEANLQGANLRWADLRGADLRGAYLYGAALQGADLQGVILSVATEATTTNKGEQ